ncbi:MAG: universal stress protein [Nitrospirae bacterium]|nr:universal stress protein [Nitrospirota bacterium]NTW66514.1 universal stress protein [Nitrospirota bacterium]
MPNRSILVADDIENQTDSGRRRSRAIRNAASFLAQRLKTGIDLVYVEDAKTYPAGKLGSFRFSAWHAKHEEQLKEAAGQFSVPVTCSLKSGSPAEQILKAMRSRSSPELVVVGTQGRKGMKRLLIGSVAEEVVRYSKRPVLVIGPIAQELYRDMSGQKPLKLLVPTDLGKNSRAAERYALSLAKRMGARITLFHCLWDSINAIIVNTAYAGMAAYDLETVIDRSRDDALEAMKRKAGFFQKQGVACGYKVEEKALTSLCAVYQESGSGYAFVVMGTHGRNAFLNAFLGSTARETIMHATVPVITVHSGR